jgi:hypothetical protein
MGKVTSPDVGASFLISRVLGPFVGGWQNKTKEKSYERGSSHSKVVACASYVQLADL